MAVVEVNYTTEEQMKRQSSDLTDQVLYVLWTQVCVFVNYEGEKKYIFTTYRQMPQLIDNVFLDWDPLHYSKL